MMHQDNELCFNNLSFETPLSASFLADITNDETHKRVREGNWMLFIFPHSENSFGSAVFLLANIPPAIRFVDEILIQLLAKVNNDDVGFPLLRALIFSNLI